MSTITSFVISIFYNDVLSEAISDRVLNKYIRTIVVAAVTITIVAIPYLQAINSTTDHYKYCFMGAGTFMSAVASFFTVDSLQKQNRRIREELAEHKNKLAKHDQRLSGHDQRLSGHDQHHEKHDQRLSGHDQQFEDVNRSLGAVTRYTAVQSEEEHLRTNYQAFLKQEMFNKSDY